MAAGAGRCPCGDVAPAFHKSGLSRSFAHFQVMMAVLNREATEPLRFGQVDCARIIEHEALLTGFVTTAGQRSAAQMREALTFLVEPHAIGTLLIALSALAHDMAGAGLMPATAVHDSECTRFPDE